jgi:hypothetical protein
VDADLQLIPDHRPHLSQELHAGIVRAADDGQRVDQVDGEAVWLTVCPNRSL